MKASTDLAVRTPDPIGLGATLNAISPALDHRRAILWPRATDIPASPDTPAPSGDWIRAADLFDPTKLDDALAVIREHHQATPEIAVSYFTAWYAATIVGPAIATFVLARRVPDLNPEGISLHCHDGGWFDATAFHHTRVSVLRSDPAVAWQPTSGRPTPHPRVVAHTRGPAHIALVREPADAGGPAPGGDARKGAAGGAGTIGLGEPAGVEIVAVLDTVDALRERLVTEIVEHLEPMIRALRSRARLGPAALWGAVASQCGRAFLLTERVSRDPHRGRLEADAFFADAAPTLRARPTWQQFVHHGRAYTGMRRGSCCLAHRLTEEYCTACPFVPADERECRLREWIDAQGADGLAV